MDMIERVARKLSGADDPDGYEWYHVNPEYWETLARAAIAIVIEDCALVAESESTDGCEWIVARIAGRIRSAPEDSATQAELEKMCSPNT